MRKPTTCELHNVGGRYGTNARFPRPRIAFPVIPVRASGVPSPTRRNQTDRELRQLRPTLATWLAGTSFAYTSPYSSVNPSDETGFRTSSNPKHREASDRAGLLVAGGQRSARGKDKSIDSNTDPAGNPGGRRYSRDLPERRAQKCGKP